MIKAMSVVLLLVTACAQDQRTQPVEEDPYRSAPLHVSHNIHVHFYDSVNTRAELEAGIALLNEDRKETNLGQGVRVIFFDKLTGERAAVLRSDSAVIDDRSRDMIAIGNVHVDSDSSNTSLVTDRLVWDQHTARIRTDSEVRITSPTETIHGEGLVSDQYLTSYRIFKVRGVYRK